MWWSLEADRGCIAIAETGIAELESVSKSKNAIGDSSRSRLHPRISTPLGVGVCQEGDEIGFT